MLYGSAADSRWHECGHRTAFKTLWMNDAVYQIACFMILREPEIWRWSHTRHHTDTVIVGRDPEIITPRPPDVLSLLLNIFALKTAVLYFKKLFVHASGRLEDDEATFVPESERPKVYRTARIYLATYALVVVACVACGSILPAMYIGLPSLYGSWLQLYFGCSQHLGLAEDVLDHRLNSRTIYMNPIFRFLYWNMNYHVEHHLFPLVPYHALPKLHEAIKADCPPPYPSSIAAYREIIPALARQLKDPAYYVRRELPASARSGPKARCRGPESSGRRPMSETWIDAGAADSILREDVGRFEHDGRHYAVYRTEDDRYFATDGLCTHEQVELGRRIRIGYDHRVPDAQRTLRLHHWRSQGCASLRQSGHLSSERSRAEGSE